MRRMFVSQIWEACFLEGLFSGGVAGGGGGAYYWNFTALSIQYPDD